MDTAERVEPPALDAEARERVLALGESGRIAAGNAPILPSTASLARFEEVLAKIAPVSDSDLEAWEWKNTIVPNLKAAGLPPRFHQRITDWKNNRQRAVYRAACAKCQRTGAIVALIGARGTGKTTIAAQMIVDRASNDALTPWERCPTYRKMVDLIAYYKPLYADFGSTQTDALMATRDNYCRERSLAVIDEIHDAADQKMMSRVLTDILDRRYSSRVDTVIISNQDADSFRASIGDSVLSRIAEHGLIIPCEWETWRKPA